MSLDELIQRFEDLNPQRDVLIGKGVTAAAVATVPSESLLQPPASYFIVRAENLTPDLFAKITREAAQYVSKQGHGTLSHALVVPVIYADSVDEGALSALRTHTSHINGIYELPVIIAGRKAWLRPSLRRDIVGAAGYKSFRKSILDRLGDMYEVQEN